MEASAMSSSLQTELYFELFRQWEERVWQRNADLTKITWPAEKEKFSLILGENGMELLDVDDEFDLEDYGIFIQSLPPLLEDKAMMQRATEAALQTGQISVAEWIILNKERDPDLASRKFLTLADRKNAQAQMQQQQQQQFEAAMQQQAQASDMQKVVAEKSLENEGAANIEQMKAHRDMVKTEKKSQTALEKEDMDRQTKIILEEMKRSD